jgi:hypothetical protein
VEPGHYGSRHTLRRSRPRPRGCAPAAPWAGRARPARTAPSGIPRLIADRRYPDSRQSAKKVVSSARRDGVYGIRQDRLDRRQESRQEDRNPQHNQNDHRTNRHQRPFQHHAKGGQHGAWHGACARICSIVVSSVPTLEKMTAKHAANGPGRPRPVCSAM